MFMPTHIDPYVPVFRHPLRQNESNTRAERFSVAQTTGASKGSNERNSSTPSTGPSRFQNNSVRRDRLETVRNIPPFGTPGGCCWSTSPGRTLHDQGQSALRYEVNAAQPPRGPDLHSHCRHLLYWSLKKSGGGRGILAPYDRKELATSRPCWIFLGSGFC